VHVYSAVVLDKSEFPKLVHEVANPAARCTAVPTISASVACEIWQQFFAAVHCSRTWPLAIEHGPTAFR
jgi:hypothetical protein